VYTQYLWPISPMQCFDRPSMSGGISVRPSYIRLFIYHQPDIKLRKLLP